MSTNLKNILVFEVQESTYFREVRDHDCVICTRRIGMQNKYIIVAGNWFHVECILDKERADESR